MISEGKFSVSLNEAHGFLKNIELFKSLGRKRVGNHSSKSKKVAKNNKHTEIYSVAVEEMDYDIILKDDSIFQFSRTDQTLRYSFIQNPRVYTTKQDYLIEFMELDDLNQFSVEDLDKMILDINDHDYEQYLNEQELNIQANIFRYDLDEKGYAPLLHSYSHIHIGLNEDCRLTCSKVLTPFKFVLFSIKNTYYKQWKGLSEKDENFNKIISDCKNNLDPLPAEFWKQDDEGELYFT
ncbi:DUF2290 domain-containing protein [Chitinophaga polysaccharea]|uniref:DUF2290 domain-containing protein n=1 Tax=Chitinophaga polysaccharea TaxID=1293035 RepID=UPI0014550076|nr:DUF2290 domain-containing protein [Chitinophaga polysaccharea]NLR58859.1 DUF2290 domain-containing protein [Chitinophaga polysaccharea]